MLKPTIIVIGVGGAGCNAINSMLECCDILTNESFVAMNTDAQSLEACNARRKVQLGDNGLGAGSDPDVGRNAAEFSIEEIRKVVEGADLVVICAGFGGGTGSGAASVVARAAREQGSLVVGIVTKPFAFEGSIRMKVALKAIEDFKENADTTIVVSNQLLFKVTTEYTILKDAFRIVDNMFAMFLKCLMSMLDEHGLINLDFADLKTTIKDKGDGVIGIGYSEDPVDAAEQAAKKALANPLLENTSINFASNALVYITSNNMSLSDVEIAMNAIRAALGDGVHIINGMAIVDSESPFMKYQNNNLFCGSETNGMNQKWIMVTLIATGIKNEQNLNNQNQQTNEDDIDHIQASTTPQQRQTDNLFNILSSRWNKKV
jgi:cell division protein FtsZ